MTAEPKSVDSDHDEVIKTVLELAEREQDFEELRRALIFSVGVSVGLILSLYLVLRRDA